MLELGVALVAVSLLVASVWWIAKVSAAAERGKQTEGSLDAVDKAKEVARDVAREPDPVQRLRDKWRRPVQGKPADPDRRSERSLYDD